MPVLCTPEESREIMITTGPSVRLWIGHVNGYTVSTVFLTIDHNVSGHGDPVLFETMVFSEAEGCDKLGMDHHMQRYTTYDQARRGHEKLMQHLASKRRASEPAVPVVPQPRARKPRKV